MSREDRDMKDWLRAYQLRQRLRDAIRKMEMSRRRQKDRTVAVAFLATLDEATRDELAIAAIADLVWDIRRERQRAVEKAAEVKAPPAPHDVAKAAEADLTTYFGRVLEDPTQAYSDTGTPFSQRRNRDKFRRWCGPERFSEWLPRARVAVDNTDELPDYARSLFDGDWHPDGPAAAARERHVARMVDLIAEFRQEIRLEVTAELLETQFALGDGRRVTWGEATEADHRKRIALLSNNAAANLEVAARHEVAIQMLADAGLSCLSEMPLVTASHEAA